MTVPKYIFRKDQPTYCAERGLQTTQFYLQKLASVGGGPKYVIIGNRAASTPEWLDEWIARRTSAPRYSTSEAA